MNKHTDTIMIYFCSFEIFILGILYKKGSKTWFLFILPDNFHFLFDAVHVGVRDVITLLTFFKMAFLLCQSVLCSMLSPTFRK